jgi:hypothetical protein
VRDILARFAFLLGEDDDGQRLPRTARSDKSPTPGPSSLLGGSSTAANSSGAQGWSRAAHRAAAQRRGSALDDPEHRWTIHRREEQPPTLRHSATISGEDESRCDDPWNSPIRGLRWWAILGLNQ